MAGPPSLTSQQSLESGAPVGRTRISKHVDPAPVQVSNVRKKWRQVANYIPEPPSDDNEAPRSVSKYLDSKNKIESSCILCPGVCVCRKYLTEEEFASRTN